CRLAEPNVGDRHGIPWSSFAADYRLIRDRISRVVSGFDDFESKVARPGGFLLPHAPRNERRFPTPSGKANFTANRLDVLRLPNGRLILQTIRSHDQFNTTIYGLNDRYRGVHHGRRVVMVTTEAASAQTLNAG